MRGTDRKAPLLVQVADVLRRARAMPPGPARDDLRQLAAGLLKLYRRGISANVQLVERRGESSFNSPELSIKSAII
jgi:hypothetical protein